MEAEPRDQAGTFSLLVNAISGGGKLQCFINAETKESNFIFIQSTLDVTLVQSGVQTGNTLITEHK